MQSQNKKILLCAPRDAALGGIARCVDHVMTYYESLGKAGVEVELFRMERTSLITPTTGVVKRLRLGVKDYFSILSRFGNRLKSDDKVDIVHIATSGSFGFVKDVLMLRRAKRAGLKTILHFHFGRVPEILKSGTWEKFLLKQVLRLSDCVIVIDRQSYDSLRGVGYAKVAYLPNPVAPSVIDFVKRNEIKREERTVLFAGHVYPTKGVNELVAACSQIPNLKVKMIGAVSDAVRTSLEDAWQKSQTENELQIVGQVDFTEVLKEMMSCAAFVLPTYTEGFPNVILESMACGCAIVTTPVGAIPEMLNIEDKGAECGIVVPVRNVDRLKEAIELILDNSDYSLAMGVRAKQRVIAEYSIDSVWKKTVKIWNSL